MTFFFLSPISYGKLVVEFKNQQNLSQQYFPN